jgi:Membrane proteins related to metalloendopeptidases
MSKRKPKRKLNFSKEELKIDGLEKKSETIHQKLGMAKTEIPTKKVRKKVRVFDEKTQKPKNKLSFEQEAVPIGEAKWNQPKKKSLPQKAVGAVATAGVNKIHSKIYEVEGENVGTQAAHKAELASESAFRGAKKTTHSAYRFAKNTPYRKASKLEVQSIKTDMKLSYQKALRDNPKLKLNPVSRFFQKRRIKKQYAAALKTAKGSAKTAKAAGGFVHKTTQAVTGIVRKNPIVLLKTGLLMLIIFAIMAMLSMCGTLLSGGSAFIGATSYAAEDVTIDNAELNYTEWETDLQIEIQNAENTHSGYDEYRYNIGDIGHDPFELMAFMTAVYEDFSDAQAQSVLSQLFAEQYQLSFIPEVEIRTRTETRTGSYTDPDTGESHSYSYEVEVEYEWHILNVNLVSQSFYHVIYPRMSADQRQHFEILMQSKGNRQYVGNPFEFNWLPYVTSYYGYRIHPISGDKSYHRGIDIGLPTGTEILAGFDGIVTAAGYDAGGFGNYVAIQMITNSGDVIEAKYAHCDSLLVNVGQSVESGDVIATVGNTGNSTGSHLHFEVLKNGQYLNPIYFAITGDDGSSRIPPGSPGGVAIPPYSGEPMGDGSYAALLAEAQRFIGYPYVWGGSSPSTSFDCSGYISWIINQSGVGSVGRQTAQGLYNLCTPVSPADARPGDLLFFHSTYSSPNPVSHVALYLGGDTFIHCGDPIGYASLSSSYWQSHFYAFARLP